MKPEKWIFWFLAIFFAIVAPAYWLISGEIAGTFVLLFSGLLGAMIAGYLTLTARTFDPRPEDRKDGEIYEAAGEVGFFAPKSIWPLWVALTMVVILLGPALQMWWITIMGMGMGIWSTSGWLFEFYRGDYRH